MNRNAATSATPMLKYGVNERFNLFQVQVRNCQVLGKETDATLWTVDREADAAGDTIELQATIESDSLRLRKTDYVGTRGIRRAVRFGRSPDDVAKDLNNAHG